MTLFFGQINLVLLALVVGDLALPDRIKGKGIGIGLAAGIKLTPLIFIPYLLFTRRVKAAAVSALTFAVTVGLGFALLPHASAVYWGGKFARPGSKPFHLDNQSLNGVILRLTHAGPGATRTGWSRRSSSASPGSPPNTSASKRNLEEILDSGSAPQIEQLPERKTERINDTAKVTVRLTDTGGGIGNKVVWRVNGVTRGELNASEPQAATTRGSYRIATQTLRIDPTKKNVIEITAYNGAGLLATEPYVIEIDKFGETEERPHMYVLSVGVSDYAKSEWHLKYAANDAETMGDTLKSVARGLYGEPKVVALLDKEATAKGIEAAIVGLKGEVKPADVFVLYVAGHGRSIAGTYYFLPQDLQPSETQSVMNSGISQDMLQTWLAEIPALKSILILDTCESAAARGDTEQETAIDRLQHATGRSVITAASSAAFEGYQGHGLLTYAILEELTKPEGSGDEEVTLAKLAAHVYKQVPAISQRVFGERQQPHNTIADDFPLGERVAALTKPESEPAIAKTPTHVLIRAERVREQPSSAQGERTLAVGTLVRVVQPSQGWALIAREGEKLGYVPEEALAPIQ